MTWNYRVVLHDRVYGIYEAFYDDAGNVNGITEMAVSPIGESLEELKRDMDYYMDALNRPVLNYSDIGTAEDEVEATRTFDTIDDLIADLDDGQDT